MGQLHAYKTVLHGSRRGKLACLNCRKRRKGCDGGSPCHSCLKLNIDCVPAVQDLRKERIPKSYINTLETHIAYLEASFSKMKAAKDIREIKKILQSLPINDVNQDIPEGAVCSNSGNSTGLVAPKLGNMVYSSIYPSDSLNISKEITTSNAEEALPGFLSAKARNLSKDPYILSAMSNFFRWLYPGHYMFIHRETLLKALFEKPTTKSYYCSEELVLAVASLGSQIAESQDELLQKADEFYATSKSLVLGKIFQANQHTSGYSKNSSKLAIIQTLLCLAFYDIGRGENPMAWYFSGLAFRIAHEVGLHLNPKTWNNVYASDLSRIDVEVRSRIYWGCYIADHLICTLFGRSKSLRLSNSTTPETEDLPDIEAGIEMFQYDPAASLSVVKPLKSLIALSKVAELFVRKIFGPCSSLTQRDESLNKLNMSFHEWRCNLPSSLKWSKTCLKTFDFDPTKAFVWIHFYVVSLSYNKPFINDVESCRMVVKECIEDLYYLFSSFKRKNETLCKSSLYLCYSAILAVQCIKFGTIQQEYLEYFMNFLKSPSQPYDLGRKILELELDTESFDVFGFFASGDDYSSEFDFEFVLSNCGIQSPS